MALEDTPHLGLPLPHPDNSPRTVDVPRLRAALTAIDGYLKDLQDAASALEEDKADKAQVAIDIATAVSQAISDLLSGAPEAYDTLKEIADKLADNDDVVAGLLSAIGSLQGSLQSLAITVFDKADLVDGKVPAAQLAFATKPQAEAGEATGVAMTPLRTAQAIAAKRGAANGVASLDGSGKVPLSEIPTLPYAQIYQGEDDAEVNFPIGTILMTRGSQINASTLNGDANAHVNGAWYHAYASGVPLNGSWRVRGVYSYGTVNSNAPLIQRVA